ncbi:SDR family oxidoreductase [Nocardioidaceae bacterium]|nr:SDR family oxidoreductase [Nocardioidaceae bacterium]
MTENPSESGRHVFIAGGTSGINLGIAEAYAAAGAQVAVLGRSQEKIDAALERLAGLGSADRVAGFSADVRDAEAVGDALGRAVDRFGTIDVVVAGNFLAPAAEMSPNAFKSVVDIDLLGTFNTVRMAYEHLTRPGASVVAITAAQSWLPSAWQAHVGAAKAGVDQLVRTLAVEWGPEGVRCNAVAPGPIEGTEGMKRLAPTEKSVQAWTDAVPLGRFGTPEDIANAVRWISSPLASYLTGQVISVDGGLQLLGSGTIVSAVTAG